MGLRRDKDDTPKGRAVRLELQLMPMGEGWIAISTPGGVRVRGQLQNTPAAALQNLFINLGNGNGDADIALEMLANGTTLSDVVEGASELNAGSD